MAKKKRKRGGRRGKTGIVPKDSKNPWFQKDKGSKGNWSFIPLNWKGWVALGVLIFLNVFSAQYFDLWNNWSSFDDLSSVLIIFLLSLFVFIMISKRKTKA